MTQGVTSLSAGQHCHLHRKWDDTTGNRQQTAESEIEHDVVNHLLINLSEPFFDTTVGPRPNLARMCG